MKKLTKKNWQIIAFTTIAVLSIMCTVQMQAAAQSNRLSFNYLFPPSASPNPWLKDVAGNFDLTSVNPKIAFSTKSNPDDEFPTPDFSAMAKYIEVKKWEYDIYAAPPQLHLLIVIKQKSRPRFWDLRFEDADGVLVKSANICDTVHSYPDTELNVPLKCNIWIPDEKQMKTVKTIRAVKDE